LIQASCCADEQAKYERRVGVGELDDVGERPSALADRLPYRPQPGTVDVGVPDRDHPVRTGRGWLGQGLGEFGAGGGGGAGDVVRVGRVDRPLQRDEDLRAPAGGDGQLIHQAGQRPDVGPELPDSDVAQVQCEFLDHVQLGARQRGRITVRCGMESGDGDVGVGGGLEIDVDRLAWLYGDVVVER
jgi:hypothetical protein